MRSTLDISHLARATGLTELDVGGCAARGRYARIDAAQLAALTNLFRLDASGFFVTDDSSAVVCSSVTRLEHLDASDAWFEFASWDVISISAKVFFALKHLTQLRSLDITGNAIAESQLSEIVALVVEIVVSEIVALN